MAKFDAVQADELAVVAKASCLARSRRSLSASATPRSWQSPSANCLVNDRLCDEWVRRAPHRRIYNGRYLDEAAIERIVTSCKADTAVEIRDKAIILLLDRLGLQAGDVCQLRLADIDWYPDPFSSAAREDDQAGCRFLRTLATPFSIMWTVLARGLMKSDCCCGRWRPSRHSVRQPRSPASYRGCSIAAPSRICRPVHTFRHSLATRMLRACAGLESVGTILRQRLPATTAIYAKVDIPMLLKVAQPWPGDLSC